MLPDTRSHAVSTGVAMGDLGRTGLGGSGSVRRLNESGRLPYLKDLPREARGVALRRLAHSKRGVR